MLQLAAILILGIFGQWFAWRVKIPAILPLIVLGLLVGPVSSLLTTEGTKWINTDTIFQGHYLFDFVSLAVGVILFEGGLTLKISEVRQVAGVIRNIIVIGSIVTLFGGTWAMHYFLGIEYKIAFLFGSLVIVTGPTVIRPILNNVRPKSNISTILKWEGVLIDPFGAFVAILIFDFILSGATDFSLFALKGFFLIVLSGIVAGTAVAFLIKELLKRDLIPHHLLNVVVLALAVFCFVLSDYLHAESGLLSVTLCGMILSNTKVKGIDKILSFKEEITVILISVLFILLSARMNVADFEKLGVGSIGVFAVLVFIIRPLGVFLSSIGSTLSLKEKIFISWISPRGIVSAGVASIFTLKLTTGHIPFLTALEVEQASLLLPMTFMVIVGTVVLQGSTAKYLAKALNLIEEHPKGILIMGANDFAQLLGEKLVSMGLPVLLTDTSEVNAKEARLKNLNVHVGNLLTTEIDDFDFAEYGMMLALTPSPGINVMACKSLSAYIGRENVFRLMTKKEFEIKQLNRPEKVLFEGNHDFIQLSTFLRETHEIEDKYFETYAEYQKFYVNRQDSIVPLFFQLKQNRVIPVTCANKASVKSFKLIYLKHQKG